MSMGRSSVLMKEVGNSRPADRPAANTNHQVSAHAKVGVAVRSSMALHYYNFLVWFQFNSTATVQ